MIPLTIAELKQLDVGRLEATGDRVTGVKIDSRLVEPGDLFVAIGKGKDFLAEARSRGAAATLVPKDAFAAVGAIGSAIRRRSSTRIVGITGSTGKTSTKDILHALCSPVARTVAAEASFNNELGVPLTLCRLEPDRRRAIELALDKAQPGDVVVIAGKGHEQGQEFADRKLPFDDREVARELLRSAKVQA